MTCIVGLQTDTGVIIGGDSSGSSGYLQFHRGDPKVFHNGPYLIGYTSSFRMGQLLRYADLPDPEHADGLDRFMVTEFIARVRTVLKDGGYATKTNDREEGGQFLVAVRGQLYNVDNDYHVGWSRDGYSAVGCGRELAMGALHATRNAKPDTRVRRALEAAAHHNTDVHGPFTILTQFPAEPSAVESETR